MKINSINQSQYNYGGRNQNKNTAAQNASASFKGANPQTSVVNGLSKFYENVAKTKPFQKFIKGFSHSDKTFTHLLVMESCILSGFYMINTLRNKKIEKEQKPQMILNDTFTLGVSTAGAYLAEDKITSLVEKGSEKYFANHKDFYKELGKKAQEAAKSSPKNDLLKKVGETAAKTGDDLIKGAEEVSSMIGSQLKGIVGESGKLKTFQIEPEKLKQVQTSVKDAVTKNAGNADKAKETVKGLVDDVYNSAAARAEADKTFSGINKLKVLVIFGIIYRYLSPVIFTPIANKLSAKLFDNKKGNSEAKKPEETKQKK